MRDRETVSAVEQALVDGGLPPVPQIAHDERLGVKVTATHSGAAHVTARAHDFWTAQHLATVAERILQAAGWTVDRDDTFLRVSRGD